MASTNTQNRRPLLSLSRTRTRRKEGPHLKRHFLVCAVAEEVGVEAEVALKHIEPALHQNTLAQRAHIVVHHLLRGGGVQGRGRTWVEAGVM